LERYTPLIPEAGKLRQEDHKFEASLGYLAWLSQTKQDTILVSLWMCKYVIKLPDKPIANWNILSWKYI
jgi:hypothetical protein